MPPEPPSADSTIETALDEALALHRQGALTQAEAAYRALLRREPDHPRALHLLGVLLQQCGRHAQSVDLLAAAAQSRPDDAEIQGNLGVALQALGRREQAYAALSAALRLKPDYPEALNNRGNVLRTLRRYEAALADYDRALQLRPGYPDALSNRANTLRRMGRLDAALADTDLALQAAPGFAPAWNIRGAVLTALGRLDEALASFGQATRIQPTYADAYFNESLCRLLQGDFRRGWALHEWRWLAPGLGVQARACSQPVWLGVGGDVLGAASPWPVSGVDLRGRTILLHAEQGYGDSLQFCRYAPLLAAQGARVLLEVPPPLGGLMRSLAGVDVFVAGGALPAFDLHCPLMSLPHALGVTLDTLSCQLPYLSADPARVEHWRSRLAGEPASRPLVGLAWSGNPAHANDKQRSIPLAVLAPLFDLPLHFVGLQPEMSESDRAALAHFGVRDVAAELTDFSETAALLACVDHVVTIDSAVAHLAGALGRPATVLLPHAPDFRWLLGRDDTPWYPTLHLLRQRCAGDWADVISRLAGVLVTRSVR